MNIQFGTGVVQAVPVSGNLPALPTPLNLAVLQEVTVDFKADLKKLYGQKQLAVATARGKIDCTIKGKLAVFDPQVLNQLYFAQAIISGYNLPVYGESQTVNTNAVTATNTPLAEDWGVSYELTGEQLTYNPNTLALVTGEYSVNLTSGVYTVDETNGTVLKISYTYAVNTGETVTIANQLMGYAPELKMILWNRFREKLLAVELNAVTLGSINIPTKLEDFWIMDFDGSANADASDTLGKLMMDTY